VAGQIMVDVPWPWWVTTAAASAVALAAAAGVWRLRPAAARGALALLAVQCLVTAAAAPLLMPAQDAAGGMTPAAPEAMAAPGEALDGEISIGGMGGGAMSTEPAPEAVASAVPFRFAVDGGSARGAGGATLTLTGEGGWDPAGGRVEGGGEYEIDDGGGGFERGAWRATRFLSFLQQPAAADAAPGTLAGELRLGIAVEGLGTALLTAGDRLTLVGDGIRFGGTPAGEAAFEFSLGAYAPRREEGR
jgi:hypothetical protein